MIIVLYFGTWYEIFNTISHPIFFYHCSIDFPQFTSFISKFAKWVWWFFFGHLFWQGFDDALQFLQRNRLISCTRCLSVQSTFTLQESAVEDEDLDYDPDCGECRSQRQVRHESRLLIHVFESRKIKSPACSDRSWGWPAGCFRRGFSYSSQVPFIVFIHFFFVLRIFSSCRYARRCLVTISLCELGLESTKVRSFGLDTIVSSTGVTWRDHPCSSPFFLPLWSTSTETWTTEHCC